MAESRGGIQLLPGTKKRLGIKIPGENRFLYIGSAILGAVLVTSFALVRYEGNLNSRIAQLDNRMVQLEQERDKGAEAGLKNLKKQIDITSDLIEGHLYWTEGFAKLVGLLQSDIQFKSLSVSSETEKVDITGTATSYLVLARQVASFLTGEGVVDVALGEIILLPSGNLDFSMNIEINKTKFVQK